MDLVGFFLHLTTEQDSLGYSSKEEELEQVRGERQPTYQCVRRGELCGFKKG